MPITPEEIQTALDAGGGDNPQTILLNDTEGQPVEREDAGFQPFAVTDFAEVLGTRGQYGAGDYPELDQGFDPVLIEQDPTYLNRFRAQSQDGWEQARHALAGGFTKGVMTAAEDLSYLTIGLPNTINSLLGNEAAETNAVAEWAKDNKKELDKRFPIFREQPDDVIDLSDPAFYWSSLSSLLDSAVGFGAAGGLAGGAAGKVLGKAAKIARLGSKTTRAGQMLTAGAVNNLAEGKMIALEAFEKGTKEDKKKIAAQIQKETVQMRDQIRTAMDRLYTTPGALEFVPSGVEGGGMTQVIAGTDVTPQQWAEQQIQAYQGTVEERRKALEKRSLKLRGEQSNKMQQLNLLMLASDVTQVRGLFKAGTALRREAMESGARRMTAAFRSKEGASQALGGALLEGVEEAYQEGIGDETGFRVQRELGLAEKRKGIDRFIDFAVDPKTRLSFAMGVLGGPVQTSLTTLTGSLGGAVTGSTAERRAYNQRLQQDQAATTAALEQYVSNNLATAQQNHEDVLEAMRTGDEVQAAALQEQSFADVFFRAAQTGTVNTLEQQLDGLATQVQEQTEEGQDLDTTTPEAVAEMRVQMPQLEALYTQAERDAIRSVGTADPSLVKALYDLSVRTDISRRKKEQLQAEFEDKYQEAYNNVNDRIVNTEQQLTDMELRRQKLEDQRSSLEATQKRLQDSQKTLQNRVNRRANRQQDIFTRLTQRSLQEQQNKIQNKIQDTQNELNKVEQEIQQDNQVSPGKKAAMEQAVEQMKKEQAYQEGKESSDKAVEMEALQELYTETRDKVSKKGKQFTQEQNELFTDVVNSALERQRRRVEGVQDVEATDAPLADDTEQEAEQQAPPADPITDQEFQEFTDNNTVQEATLDSIAQTMADNKQLSARQEAIRQQRAQEVNDRLDKLKKEADRRKKAERQQASDKVADKQKTHTVGDKVDTDTVVQDTMDAGLASTEQQAVSEALPELRRAVENNETKPPEGMSKDAYLDVLDQAIREGRKKHVPSAEQVTEQQISNYEQPTQESWERENLSETVDNSRQNGQGAIDFTENAGGGEPQDAPTYAHNRKLTTANALAFSSNLNETDARGKALAQFLEDPSINLANYGIRYELETDVNAGTTALEREAINLLNKQNKTKNERTKIRGNVPVRMVLVDNQGNDVQVNGQILYGHTHNRHYSGYANNPVTVNQILEFFGTEDANFEDGKRGQIVDHLLAGSRVTTDITRQRRGYANHRYRYKTGSRQEVEWRIRNTQDKAQEEAYQKIRDQVKLEPVRNNINNVLNGDPVTLAVGTENGNIATYQDGKLETLPQPVVKVKGRYYFRIQAANGEYGWYAAYVRPKSTKEKAMLKALSEGKTLDEIRDTYATEIEVAATITGKEVTAQSLQEFYKESQLTIDPKRFNEAGYVEALTKGDNPVLFTTLAALDTASSGREGMNNVFIQPTVEVSMSYRVNDQNLSQYNTVDNTPPRPAPTTSSTDPVSNSTTEAQETTSPEQENSKAIANVLNKWVKSSKIDKAVLRNLAKALQPLVKVTNRAQMGEYLNGMSVLASDIQVAADGVYAYAVRKVMEVYGLDTTDPTLVDKYSIYANYVQEQRDDGVPLAESLAYTTFKNKAGYGDVLDTFRAVERLQYEVFRDKKQAKALTDSLMGVQYVTNPTTNEAYTHAQQNQAARSKVKEGVNNKVEDIQDPQAPETTAPRDKQVLNEGVNETPAVQDKVNQLRTTNLPGLLHGITLSTTDKDTGKLDIADPNAIHEAIRDFIENIKPGGGEVQDAVTTAISNAAEGKSKKLQEGLSSLARLVGTASDQQLMDFVSAYNPELATHIGAGDTTAYVQQEQQTRAVEDNIYNLLSPDPTTSSPVETREDVVNSLRGQGAELEHTDEIADVTLTADELSQSNKDFIPDTLAAIRSGLNYNTVSYSLPDKYSARQADVDFMLNLQAQDLADWRRIEETYRYLQDVVPSAALELGNTDFTRAFEQMQEATDNILGEVMENTPVFKQLMNSMFVNIGHPYLTSTEHKRMVVSANKFLRDFMGTMGNVKKLQGPGELAMYSEILEEMFFTSEEGKKHLIHVPTPAQEDIGKSWGYEGNLPRPLIIGYAANGSPIVTNYVRAGSDNVTAKLTQLTYINAFFTNMATVKHTFDELYNDSTQVPLHTYNLDWSGGTVKVDGQTQDIRTEQVFIGAVEEGNFRPTVLTVDYADGRKFPTELRFRNGRLQARRLNTQIGWVAARQNHIEAYMQYLAREYKKECN